MNAIEFNHVGKMYRLGTIGTGTLSHDLNRWWQTTILHREDPYLKIGQTNDRTTKGDSQYVWALRDIDFKVEQGDVVGIIGKNGAGKSTLLKLLSNITSPTTGEISYEGRIASLLEVGTGFHPEMTGRENIYMNGAIMGMTRDEITRKLDEIVDFAGCARYIDTPVKRYSSGMTVRLGFAIAAFLEPEILVVDEVLAVGDAEFQKKAIGKMQDVSKGEGRTVLFVSHNMGSIKQLCNHAVLLEHGQVAYMGPTQNTIEKYLSIDIDNIQKPLLERTDRLGNGKIRFSEVIYKDKKGTVVNEVFVGEQLDIEVHFQINDPDVDFAKAIIACNLTDSCGSFVVCWVSDELPHNFSYLKDGIFTLHVPALYLRPQTYNLMLQLSIRDTSPDSWCDQIYSAAQLIVLSDEVFIPGVTITSYRGHQALIPAKFV